MSTIVACILFAVAVYVAWRWPYPPETAAEKRRDHAVWQKLKWLLGLTQREPR